MEEDISLYLSGATNRRQLFEDRDSTIRFKNKQNEDIIDVTFEKISILGEEQERLPTQKKVENQNSKIKEEVNDYSSTLKCQQEKKNQLGGEMSTSLQFIYQQEENKNTAYKYQKKNSSSPNLNQVWRKQFFNLFYMIIYVIRLIKQQKCKLNPQMFNKLAVDIIADKAFDKSVITNEKDKQKVNNTKAVINRKKCKFFNLIKIVNKIYSCVLTSITYTNEKFIKFMIYVDQKIIPWDPYSAFIIFWERIQLVCLIYAFFYIPFRTNVQQISMHEDLHIVKQELFNLFTLITLDILVGHIVACQWVALGQWQKLNNMDNWIDLSGLQNVSILSIYIKSLYFSIVTMNTVGYGDFTPKTDLERIIDVVIILIGCVLFGYSIGKIGTILQSITKNRENLIQSMGGVNLYMRQNNIELDLQNKIRKYLEYIYIKRDQEIQSNEFINQLSNNLQREILIKVQGGALKKIDIFTKNFSNEFIEELSLKVKQIYFCSDEIIHDECQHIANPSIYILNQGRVEINFRETTCRTLKEKGEYFGQVEFFKMEYQSCYTIKSLGMSSLFQVSLLDFLSLLEKYPIEKENFYKISHSVKFYQSFQHISTACRICCSISHIEQDCNYIQYKPNHFKLVRQLHQTQQREKYSQRKLSKYNSITNQKYVENALYSTDNDDESEDFSQTPPLNTGNGIQNQQINNLDGKNDQQNDSIFSNTFDQQNSLNEENQTDLNNECVTLMQKKLSQQQKEQNQSSNRGQIIQVYVQQPSKEIELGNKLNVKSKPISQSDLQEIQSLSRKSIASISSKKKRGSLSLAIDQFQSKSLIDQRVQTTSIGNIENQQKEINSSVNIKNEQMQNKIKLNGASIPQIDQIKDFRNVSKSQDYIVSSDQNLPISDLQQKAFSQIQIQEQNSQFLDDKINEKTDQNNFNQQGQNFKTNTSETTMVQSQLQQQIKPRQIEIKKDYQEQNQIEIKQPNHRRRSLPFLQLGPPLKQKQNEIILNNQSISNIQNETFQDNQIINYHNNPSFMNLNSQLANHFDSLKTQLMEFMQQNTLQTQLVQLQQQQQLLQLNPRKQQFYSQSFGSKLYFKDATTEQNNYGIQNMPNKLESQLDDIGKDYKIYFPQNNKSNVISLINLRKQKTGGLNKSNKFKHRNTQKNIKQKKSEFMNQK
ncbi:hypothetical protein ABPG74_014028 [Tetrahymena malaccensis]